MPKITLKTHNYYATFKILPELSVSTLMGGQGFFVTAGWLFSFVQLTVYFNDNKGFIA